MRNVLQDSLVGPQERHGNHVVLARVLVHGLGCGHGAVAVGPVGGVEGDPEGGFLGGVGVRVEVVVYGGVDAHRGVD